MAAATVNPNTPTTQPPFTTAEGCSCARCPNKTTDGPFCPQCVQLVRLELAYELSLERRSDCGSLDGGEL